MIQPRPRRRIVRHPECCLWVNRRGPAAVTGLTRNRHVAVAAASQAARRDAPSGRPVTPMPPFERRLQERFPHWFDGRRASIARPLLRTIGRWSRFDQIEAFLEANGHLRDFDFVGAALDHLQVRYLADPAEVARIPASGRLLIVANHPSGAIDALALLDLVGRVRRDVKIVANDLLSALEPLSGLLLPVRILGGRPERAEPAGDRRRAARPSSA